MYWTKGHTNAWIKTASRVPGGAWNMRINVSDVWCCVMNTWDLSELDKLDRIHEYVLIIWRLPPVWPLVTTRQWLMMSWPTHCVTLRAPGASQWHCQVSRVGGGREIGAIWEHQRRYSLPMHCEQWACYQVINLARSRQEELSRKVVHRKLVRAN